MSRRSVKHMSNLIKRGAAGPVDGQSKARNMFPVTGKNTDVKIARLVGRLAKMR